MDPNQIFFYLGAFLVAVVLVRLALKVIVRFFATVIGGVIGVALAVLLLPFAILKAVLFPPTPPAVTTVPTPTSAPVRR